jgi:hypothetical protein
MSDLSRRRLSDAELIALSVVVQSDLVGVTASNQARALHGVEPAYYELCSTALDRIQLEIAQRDADYAAAAEATKDQVKT